MFKARKECEGSLIDDNSTEMYWVSCCREWALDSRHVPLSCVNTSRYSHVSVICWKRSGLVNVWPLDRLARRRQIVFIKRQFSQLTKLQELSSVTFGKWLSCSFDQLDRSLALIFAFVSPDCTETIRLLMSVKSRDKNTKLTEIGLETMFFVPRRIS